MSSKPETILPIPVQYARYAIHREGPKYTTCRQTHDGMIHLQQINSTKMRYKHIDKLSFVNIIYMYQLYMNATALLCIHSLSEI